MHFMYEAVALRPLEGEQVADIGLHRTAARQHEVEHEEQHDDVDGEIDDSTHHVLPHSGEHGDERRKVAFLPQVVARTLVEQFGEALHGMDQRLWVGRKVLYAGHEHPPQERYGNQETEHGLSKQQGGRRTAAPSAAFGQEEHLAAQQHVDGRRTHQSAQEGGQFDENRSAQSENQRKERIAPVSFPKIPHTPPEGQGACRTGHTGQGKRRLAAEKRAYGTRQTEACIREAGAWRGQEPDAEGGALHPAAVTPASKARLRVSRAAARRADGTSLRRPSGRSAASGCRRRTPPRG